MLSVKPTPEVHHHHQLVLPVEAIRPKLGTMEQLPVKAGDLIRFPESDVHTETPETIQNDRMIGQTSTSAELFASSGRTE